MVKFLSYYALCICITILFINHYSISEKQKSSANRPHCLPEWQFVLLQDTGFISPKSTLKTAMSFFDFCQDHFRESKDEMGNKLLFSYNLLQRKGYHHNYFTYLRGFEMLLLEKGSCLFGKTFDQALRHYHFSVLNHLKSGSMRKGSALATTIK